MSLLGQDPRRSWGAPVCSAEAGGKGKCQGTGVSPHPCPAVPKPVFHALVCVVAGAAGTPVYNRLCHSMVRGVPPSHLLPGTLLPAWSGDCLGDPASPLGGTTWGSCGHGPRHWRQVCLHLYLLLFCSTLNFLLLGNEPRYPKGDSIHSSRLWVPEEHPDNRPDKGTLATGTGEPKQVCASCFS